MSDDTTQLDPAFVFTTPDRSGRTEAEQAADEVPFEINGERYTAVKPADYGFVRLGTAAARRYRDEERAAAVIEFFDLVLAPESNDRITARLMDKDGPDRLEFTDVLPVIEALVKRWGKDKPKGKGKPKPARDRARS